MEILLSMIQLLIKPVFIPQILYLLITQHRQFPLPLAQLKPVAVLVLLVMLLLVALLLTITNTKMEIPYYGMSFKLV